jgi:hypothetical protein
MRHRSAVHIARFIALTVGGYVFLQVGCFLAPLIVGLLFDDLSGAALTVVARDSLQPVRTVGRAFAMLGGVSLLRAAPDRWIRLLGLAFVVAVPLHFDVALAVFCVALWRASMTHADAKVPLQQAAIVSLFWWVAGGIDASDAVEAEPFLAWFVAAMLMSLASIVAFAWRACRALRR